MEKGKPRLLFISGSIGMGHVTRDLAILKELRKMRSDIEVDCLAGEPAATILRNAGWTMLSECEEPARKGFADGAETSAKDYVFVLWKTFLSAQESLDELFRTYLRILERGHYDLVVGDEAYEVIMGYFAHPEKKNVPFIWMVDFAKDYALTRSPKERFMIWMLNRSTWHKAAKSRIGTYSDANVFFGEPEDMPDERLGLLLRRVSDLRSMYSFVGYSFDFDPRTYLNQAAIRKELGYGMEKLIVCSIGGTAVGRPLLDLCARAYPHIKEKVPEAKMLIVAGPRLKVDGLGTTDGIEIREYVPELYKHFAASDIAIVQGGSSTTVELTALKRQFIFFPLEGHFEQQVNVANSLRRHRAGIKMRYPETTPQMLADMVVANLGRKVDFADIPVDGARKVAELIVGFMPP